MTLTEIFVLLGSAGLLAMIVIFVLAIGAVGLFVGLIMALAVGILVVVAAPHTPTSWDLPHLLPGRARLYLLEARLNHGWGDVWGGYDNDRSV